jgi:signal peptidase I
MTKTSKRKTGDWPSLNQLEEEFQREQYWYRFRRTLKSTIYALITVAAIAILVATLWLPVLQIYGNSMNATLTSGDIVVSLKTSDVKTGDIIAFYYNNKILVKRVIATSGDWVDIKEDGTVYVNDVELNEPYVKEKALGDCNITLPYQVPESRIFVMGDHRSTSVDSRNTSVGCVAEEQIVGHLVFRLWPLTSIGGIS